MVLEGDEGARHAINHLGPTPEVVEARIAAFRVALKKGEFSFDAEWDLSQSYSWSIGALEAILVDRSDPDRRAVRALMLEASREIANDSGKPTPIPADVLTRTRSWVTHPDPFVRETGAIALTSFAVTGYEGEAVAAARRSPTLLPSTLKAFAALAATHPDGVAPHAEALFLLARSLPSKTHEDPLTELAKIPHPAVAQWCLRSLTDESLLAERRGALLLGLKPSVLPRPALIALLQDRAWQRSLSHEYFYYSFLDDVARDYPDDSEIRAETKDALLDILSDEHLDLAKHDPANDIDARAKAISSLRTLVAASDLPRLLPFLEDPRFDRRSRSQLLSVPSRVPPDDDLRQRMMPLLKDPDLALTAAQSLGRVGHPAALEVLVEQGLKRLGFYSDVDLEIGSFRPLGSDAEQALLSLLDYPNSGTRQLVRRFLIQWPSTEGRRRIRAELDEAIESGRTPQGYTLGALALAGEELVEPLLRLASEHPETIETLFVEQTEDALTEQLRRALAKESDPARARTLGKLIQQLCSCED
jgi:hypothetical protein